MSRKYFEAIGRQAASLGLSYPYITLQAPQWASDAARDGWEHQRRKSLRKDYAPYCSAGHKRKADCDCGEIAKNN